MAKEIFRKVSLERLSSPEQLDQLMQVTSPRGWVSLVAIGGLLVCGLFWGFLGYIPTKIMGQGMLLKSGGVFDVVASSGGTIKDLYFSPGDVVRKGQIVARIAQPDILDKIKKARAQLEDLQEQYRQMIKFDVEETELQTESLAQQRVNLETAIVSQENLVAWLKEKTKNQKELLERGLITKQQALSTKRDMENAEQEILRDKNQLQQLTIKQLQQKSQKTKDSTSLEQQISDARQGLDMLQKDLNELSKVRSPYTGRALELEVDEGALVSKGTSLLRIELMGKDIKNLEVVMYFPAGQGKQIKQGMTAQIAPAIVKQSEYGYLLGLVTQVSEYPSTRQAIMRTVQNETLVQSLTAAGAPLEVRADLIPDPRTPSGYKWSSSKGPNISLQTGTMCMTSVVVAKQRPISLVIPLFKKHVLGVGEDAAAQ